MATLYVIPNWEKDFENQRSREIVNATYFCVGNSFDGQRIRRLQKLKDPLELYGAFHVICAIASKCPYRGVLLNDRGPLSALDLAEKSGFDGEANIEIISRALEQLSEPMIGLLEKHDIEQGSNGEWPLPAAVLRWAASEEDRRTHRATARGGKRRQDNGDGDKRREQNSQPSPKERPHAAASGGVNGHAPRTEQNRTEPVPSAVSLEGRQQQPESGFIRAGKIILPSDMKQRQHALAFAKAVICQKILGGKDPGRPWSRDAMDALSGLLESGLPMEEIETIAWFRSLPESLDIPELRDRRPITETGLVNYWGDELSRALAYRRKRQPAAQKKQEPAKWREFFRWKYPDCRLPASYWQLEPDQREEYDRDFQTFEQTEVARA